MKKSFLFISVLFFVTGCSNDYELNINKNNIEEKVNFNIKNDDYEKANLINDIFNISDQNIEDETEFGKNIINILKNNDFQPSYESEDLYIKNIKNDNITLSYQYKDDLYSSSNIFNFCFGDTYYDATDDYYLLKGYNQFKCLIKDKMKVVIKTDYKVIDSNADKVKGNQYIWYFTKDNNLSHDLYIQVSKIYKQKNTNYWPLIITSFIIIGAIIYKFFIKNDKTDIISNDEN